MLVREDRQREREVLGKARGIPGQLALRRVVQIVTDLEGLVSGVQLGGQVANHLTLPK